jgi:hypothetical protein
VHTREDRVIDELCEYLSLREKVDVRIVRRPDREPGNSGGCDAILQRGGRQVAVEHTRVFAAPNKPRVVKVLERVRPVICRPVEAAFPESWVQIGVPAEEFAGGMEWIEVASRIGNLCVHALQGVEVGKRVRLDVAGLSSKVVAERVKEGVQDGLCWVRPVVWGRDPEELTVDDMVRALVDKRSTLESYHREGWPTVLVLDVEDLGWPDVFGPLFGRATERADASAFDEVYVAASAWNPSLIIPLKLGSQVPVGQPELGEFIGLCEELRRMRRAQ